MKVKIRYAFHPEDYCVGENERFYTEMAAWGWGLVNRGRCLSRFERREPADDVYRVEVDYRDFPEDRLELYRECGWELVTKRGFVNVFRAGAGADAPELYDHPAEQAETIRRMRRRSRLTNLLALALLLPYLAALVSLGGGPGQLAAEIVYLAVNLPGLLALYTVLLVYSILLGIDGSVRLRRLIKRLEGGLPLDHTPKRRGTAHIWAVIVLVALCLGSVAAEVVTYRRTEPMPEKSDGVYITLADLGFDGERRGILSPEDRSGAEKVWTPMADVTHARETVDHAGDWVSMDQDIYRLRIPALAGPMARALMERSDITRDTAEFEKIDVPGWDTARAAEFECVATRGGTAVRVYLFLPQNTSPPERAEVFTRILTEIAKRLDANS